MTRWIKKFEVSVKSGFNKLLFRPQARTFANALQTLIKIDKNFDRKGSIQLFGQFKTDTIADNFIQKFSQKGKQ